MTSSDELKDIDMNVYVQPGGILGGLLGRPLRFRVEEFAYIVSRRDHTLRRVEVEANSLSPKSEVYMPSRFERVPLRFSEVERILRRTRSHVLNVSRYPSIDFDVQRETPTAVEGVLHLHGESHMIQCKKTVEGAELVVRCPVSLSHFGILPYKLWLGLFSQGDEVEIETRIPSKALKL